MPITLNKQYQTRAGGRVKLTHIDTSGKYPVHGQYFDVDYQEWREGSWTAYGSIDVMPCSEDLVPAAAENSQT